MRGWMAILLLLALGYFAGVFFPGPGNSVRGMVGV